MNEVCEPIWAFGFIRKPKDVSTAHSISLAYLNQWIEQFLLDFKLPLSLSVLISRHCFCIHLHNFLVLLHTNFLTIASSGQHVKVFLRHDCRFLHAFRFLRRFSLMCLLYFMHHLSNDVFIRLRIQRTLLDVLHEYIQVKLSRIDHFHYLVHNGSAIHSGITLLR